MPTVAITLDLACCRCRSKIQKILCCIQERCGFVFEKVVYEKDKVIVTGPFDAIELCCKLRCKAGCFVTKIEIVPPPKKEIIPPVIPNNEPKKKVKKPESDPCKKLIPYPYPYPYPLPYPYPQPACPSTCPTPPRSCECHSCKPPPPPVCARPPPCPPPPICPRPPPCPPTVCPCPTWTPCHCRGYQRDICCEENLPDGPCTIM